MKVNYIKNIDTFFEVIKNCKGDVFIKSDDGNKIVLTSTLGKFLTKAILSKDTSREIIGNFDIDTDNQSDFEFILKYLINQ